MFPTFNEFHSFMQQNYWKWYYAKKENAIMRHTDK